MTIERVCALLHSLTTEQPIMPPTELYCEGWLLRVILDWYAEHAVSDAALAFARPAHWYSEALLPTPFRPRTQGDALGESRSHADGVIGQFKIGGNNKAGFALDSAASYFMVLEAKIFSNLSAGVKRVKDYNQAARTVACMAEVLRLAGRPVAEMRRLAFYVLAPEQRVSKGIFKNALDPTRIDAAIKARVATYDGLKDEWYAQCFQPTLPHVQIGVLSWEEVIAPIEKHDRVAGAEIGAFYEACLKYNA